jgi:hypothetical protein
LGEYRGPDASDGGDFNLNERPVRAKSGHSPTARRTGKFDPKATFKIGPVNGRETLESGLRLNASVAPQTVDWQASKNVRFGSESGHRSNRSKRAPSVRFELLVHCAGAAPADVVNDRPHRGLLRAFGFASAFC